MSFTSIAKALTATPLRRTLTGGAIGAATGPVEGGLLNYGPETTKMTTILNAVTGGLLGRGNKAGPALALSLWLGKQPVLYGTDRFGRWVDTANERTETELATARTALETARQVQENIGKWTPEAKALLLGGIGIGAPLSYMAWRQHREDQKTAKKPAQQRKPAEENKTPTKRRPGHLRIDIPAERVSDQFYRSLSRDILFDNDHVPYLKPSTTTKAAAGWEGQPFRNVISSPIQEAAEKRQQFTLETQKLQNKQPREKPAATPPPPPPQQVDHGFEQRMKALHSRAAKLHESTRGRVGSRFKLASGEPRGLSDMPTLLKRAVGGAGGAWSQGTQARSVGSNALPTPAPMATTAEGVEYRPDQFKRMSPQQARVANRADAAQQRSMAETGADDSYSQMLRRGNSGGAGGFWNGVRGTFNSMADSTYSKDWGNATPFGKPRNDGLGTLQHAANSVATLPGRVAGGVVDWFGRGIANTGLKSMDHWETAQQEAAQGNHGAALRNYAGSVWNAGLTAAQVLPVGSAAGAITSRVAPRATGVVRFLTPNQVGTNLYSNFKRMNEQAETAPQPQPPPQQQAANGGGFFNGMFPLEQFMQGLQYAGQPSGPVGYNPHANWYQGPNTVAQHMQGHQ